MEAVRTLELDWLVVVGLWAFWGSAAGSCAVIERSLVVSCFFRLGLWRMVWWLLVPFIRRGRLRPG